MNRREFSFLNSKNHKMNISSADRIQMIGFVLLCVIRRTTLFVWCGIWNENKTKVCTLLTHLHSANNTLRERQRYKKFLLKLQTNWEKTSVTQMNLWDTAKLFYCTTAIGAKYNLHKQRNLLYIWKSLGTIASNQMKRIQFINLFLETEIQLLCIFTDETSDALQISGCVRTMCIVQYAHSSIMGLIVLTFCCKKLSTIQKWIELRRFNFQAGKSVFDQFYMYT